MTLSEQYPEEMLPVRVIWLTQGKFTIADPEDYEMLTADGPWFANKIGKNWYAVRSTTHEHRKCTRYMHKEITGFKLTDHINRNGLDNRRANLRDATKSINTRNRDVISTNTSGFTGVSLTTSGRKWRARARANGTYLHIGYYYTAEEAHEAYQSYIRENGLV